jgi:hypothetical protein
MEGIRGRRQENTLERSLFFADPTKGINLPWSGVLEGLAFILKIKGNKAPEMLN